MYSTNNAHSATSSSVSVNSTFHYGSDQVRVCRVLRTPEQHYVVEYSITVTLESHGDGGTIVPIKDTCYVLAKTSPHVLSPDLFSLHLAIHFVTHHSSIARCNIQLIQTKWARIAAPVASHEGAGGIELHRFAFVRDGEEKRGVDVVVERGSAGIVGRVKGLLKGLHVLKSAESVEAAFMRDESTNVNEYPDALFSTGVDLEYTLAMPLDPLTVELLTSLEDTIRFAGVARAVRDAALDAFAGDESGDMQTAMQRMAEQVIERNPSVSSITYRLPKRHYVPVPLDYVGLSNTQPGEAEVFCPMDAPGGFTSGTVSRI